MSERGEPRTARILGAVAEAAEGLVRSTFEVPAAEPVLEALAIATEASRSYLFTVRTEDDGRVVADLLLEWVAEGVAAQIANPDLQGFDFEATGNRWLLDRLVAGEVVAGTSGELPEAFRPILASQQIESILMTPILVRGELWGLLGFDDCVAPRRWSAAESGALRLASSLLAAAIERRDAERELRESEARYRALFEDSSDAVWATDTEARFVALNRRAARLLGGEAEDLVGRSWAEFLPVDHLRTLDRLTDETAVDADGTGWFEVRLDGAQGEPPVWIEVRSRPVVRGTQVVGFQGTGRDVTGRRELEEQLRRIERLEAWGRMAAGVARNFDGLMTTIRGYGERLVHELRPTDPLRTDAAEVLLAADRAAELTRELVALGGAQPWQPERIEVASWVSERLPMLRRLVGGDLGLRFESASGVGAVEVDPELLEQALVALVLWLRDRQPENARIELRAEPATGEELVRRGALDAAAGRYVRLRLADDGPAIGEETASRLFEPNFVRELPATEPATGGLSTVYGIVRQCGGYLFADGSAHPGTRLDVFLPSIEAPDGEPLADATGDEPAGVATILLVEDDGLIRSLAEQILVGRGFRVLSAEGGSEALELASAEKSPIDLLLTDIVMPGTSGVDLGQRLLRQHPSMKILYMSGYSDSLVFRYGLFRDRSSLLRKPFSAEDLERKVRELLEDGSGPSPGSEAEGAGAG